MAGSLRGFTVRCRAGLLLYTALYALGFSLEETPDIIAFVATALFIGWLSGDQKRAQASLSQARDELDAKVQERTAELEKANEQLQSEITDR